MGQVIYFLSLREDEKNRNDKRNVSPHIDDYDI